MRISHACFGAFLGTAFAVSQMIAVPPAAAAVLSPQQVLPPQAIQDFLAKPEALLTEYPDGGPRMIARVRDLAASDPATLDPIVTLLQTANAAQSTAIGTGLGQVAVMAVKTDQAYANQIQVAIASAIKGHDVGTIAAGSGTGAGSAQPNIGSAVKTIELVEGVTEKGTAPVSVGSPVFLNETVRTGPGSKAELLFADRSNLAVGPVSAIKLDKFVYDPGGDSGSVVIEVGQGTFRFITGVQPSKNYEIKMPSATMGVRGTEFVIVVGPDGGETVQLLKGQVTVTTKTGQVITITDPCKILIIDAQGNPKDGGCVNVPLADFVDLGPPTTNTALADALDAFNAIAGGTTIGAVGFGGGGGGGGGGGTVTAFSTTGGFSFGGTPSLTTSVFSPPGSTFSLSFGSPGSPPPTRTTTTPTTIITKQASGH